MKITVDGQVYDYDQRTLHVNEAIDVQKKTGMRLRDWQDGLREDDSIAVKGLVYLLKLRAGESPVWDELDFELLTMEYAPDEPTVEAGENPTPAKVD